MFESLELNLLGCHHLAKGLGSCKLRIYFFIVEELVTAIVLFMELPSFLERRE